MIPTVFSSLSVIPTSDSGKHINMSSGYLWTRYGVDASWSLCNIWRILSSSRRFDFIENVLTEASSLVCYVSAQQTYLLSNVSQI